MLATVALVLAVRLWMVSRIATPWILIDELLYASLAESLAAEGRLAVRGEALATSVLYPLLIAPAWLAPRMETAYTLAKGINVVAMSAAAVPVFLWARRLAGVPLGLVAAGLTLLLSGLVFTTALMTENLFFPLFVTACYLLARALEAGSHRAWALALAGVVLVVGTRPHGLILGPILLAGALLFAALEAGGGDGRLSRELRRSLPWAAAPTAVLVLVLAGASPPVLDLGPYRGALGAAYDASDVARWAAHNAAALALAVGILPALAFAAVAGRARTRVERAFVATTIAASLGLLAVAAATSTLDPPGIRERYVFHAAPLHLVALALWLRRGAPRGPAGVAAAAAVLVLVTALPLRTIFGSGSFLGDGFSLVAFWRIARVVPGDVTTAKAVLVAGTVAAIALFLLAPRRLLPGLVPGVLALYLAASSAPVFATARNQALGQSLGSGQRELPGWIDDAVGRDAEVGFLNARPASPAEWMPVWHAEFWNRSFSAVVNVSAEEPSPLPAREARVGPDGRVTGLPQHVLVPEGVAVEGEEVARAGPLRLLVVDGAVRVSAPHE